jgi:hypothetical protein
MAINLAGPKRTSMTLHFKNAAATSSGRVHIVPSNGGWSVKIEGSRRAKRVKSTRRGAVSFAKSLKKGQRIIVHKEDGTITLKIGL